MNRHIKAETKKPSPSCNKYKISIVTIVFNGQDHIEGCLKSIINQTYTNIEYIVIDGNSTDSTLSIINKYTDNIDVFLSEKDDGIADAMNKAIDLATGDYIVFIHADDYLYKDNAIENAVKSLRSDVDLLMCDILFGKNLERKTSKGFNYKARFKTPVLHQGALCALSVFQKFGKFNKQYGIGMDYDFFLRLYVNQVKATLCPEILAVMRDTGISSRLDWASLKKRFNDEKTIHYANTQSNIMKTIYWLYWALYLPYRKITYLIKS
jgi:glycosyltransferase involved in cell wall biosynthesis